MAEAGRASPRPVVFAFLVVAALSVTPYARAWLAPPPGTAFTGAFYFTHDVYNYLSYVQQAEDGAFVFRNKLQLEPHAPALVNLEWWLSGRLSALLGRRPMQAWRLFGLGAALALLAVTDLWLRRAGLPDAHRLPALLLVSCGAGLGGLLYWLGVGPGGPVDLSAGLFPFLEFLSNPHFVAGTALLAGAVLALFSGTRAGTVTGVALATAAGVVRPYDLVMIVLVRGLGVAFTEPPGQWVRTLLPLAAVSPVVAYNYWLFYHSAAFSLLSAPTYTIPSTAGLLSAVLPALGIAALLLRRQTPAGARQRVARAHLWSWILAGALTVALRPVSYSLQFLVGIGLPLLALAALGLARFRPAATLAALVLLSTTCVAALRIVTGESSRWFVPRARLEAAQALRAACRPGDIALTPPDIGVWAIGLSPCSSYVSHPVMPDFETRTAEVNVFYGDLPPAERRAFLDRQRIAALVLPAPDGADAREWLGEGAPFRLAALVGRREGRLGIYRRQDARTP